MTQQVEKQTEVIKNNVIGINIWDDYFGDEDGDEDDITNDYDSSEIEEYNNTYAYVESGDKGEEESILQSLCDYIKDSNLLPDSELSVVFYDSETKYSEETIQRCKQENGENFFYKRFQIMFKNLSHTKREILVEKLQEIEFIYNDYTLKIYSES